jgi:hypothetical protein
VAGSARFSRFSGRELVSERRQGNSGRRLHRGNVGLSQGSIVGIHVESVTRRELSTGLSREGSE